MGRDELKQSRANSARKEKKKKKMYLPKGKKNPRNYGTFTWLMSHLKKWCGMGANKERNHLTSMIIYLHKQ